MNINILTQISVDFIIILIFFTILNAIIVYKIS